MLRIKVSPVPERRTTSLKGETISLRFEVFQDLRRDNVADGDYQVRIRMITHPHYPNVRLGDYLTEEDYLAGLEVGSLAVRRRRAPGGR